MSEAAVVDRLAPVTTVSYLYATREAALVPVMIAIALYSALPVVLTLVVLKSQLSTSQIGELGIAIVVFLLINPVG
ncbi:hypothetical protein ACPUD8_18190 [Brevibacterium sp. FAM 25378]|uniref:hypothetical protein n=1 Tax=unclassified Brevibacterium TaxID=2614124 RepID=UPI0010922604|nr:hypothetical protein [Brevibacterium sp. S22]TGD27623.1 hypothetical protein EB835_18545 [Brevibacterium sp. S22]